MTELPATTLRRIEIGAARFEDVPALIYDCAPLSTHLGVKIDGVLGFPLFREILLTLDYPGSRLLLQPAKTNALVPGTVIGFDDRSKVPLIQVRLGTRSFIALIDSGSDSAFSLNPVGLAPQFAEPRGPGRRSARSLSVTAWSRLDGWRSPSRSPTISSIARS